MDTTRPRQRDAAATRRDLLRAAQRRFTVLGYDRTTTRDVANDAGVNLTLINRYFGGKRGLFEAAVAAAPGLLADSAPEVPEDIVGDFLAGLRPDAWSEFGGHPLLLLLRDSGPGSADTGSGDPGGGEPGGGTGGGTGGGDPVQALRSLSMNLAAGRILESLGVDRGEPGSRRRQEVDLRAQLVLALFAGVVALRSMAPVEPLASADVDDLRTAVRDAIEALLGTSGPPA